MEILSVLNQEKLNECWASLKTPNPKSGVIKISNDKAEQAMSVNTVIGELKVVRKSESDDWRNMPYVGEKN